MHYEQGQLKSKALSEMEHQKDIQLLQIKEQDNGKHLLSLISPNDWGRRGCLFEFTATVRLLADHTWHVM